MSESNNQETVHQIAVSTAEILQKQLQDADLGCDVRPEILYNPDGKQGQQFTAKYKLGVYPIHNVVAKVYVGHVVSIVEGKKKYVFSELQSSGSDPVSAESGLTDKFMKAYEDVDGGVRVVVVPNDSVVENQDKVHPEGHHTPQDLDEFSKASATHFSRFAADYDDGLKDFASDAGVVVHTLKAQDLIPA